MNQQNKLALSSKQGQNPVLFLSDSSESTLKFAGNWASETLKGGEILVLKGDLASGKTTFTKGLALGLQIRDRITSPTFTLMHLHEGVTMQGKSIQFCHLDLYRIENFAQFLDLGIEDYLRSDTIVVMEWAKSWLKKLEESFFLIEFEAIKEEQRNISITVDGSEWL